MAYRALEEVSQINKKLLGTDRGFVFPTIGELSPDDKNRENLRVSALRFIRECEDLEFDSVKDPEEAQKKSEEIEKYRKIIKEYLNGSKEGPEGLTGKSAAPCQIPFYMQKDLDRLTFENAVSRFCMSGTADDAFDVYFCYLSIFFGDYRNTRDMIEMLCEFENNAGSLLMKHRDHYSHSVYVFLIGLSVYQNNKTFRDKYYEYYKKKADAGMGKGTFDEKEAGRHFLKLWGLTALFHDIGYPFELPFEQIKGYFANSIDKRTAKSVKDSFVPTMPFVSYQNMKDYLSNLNINSNEITQEELNKKIDQWTNGETVCDLSDIFALHLSKMLTKDYKYYDGKPFVDFCKDKGYKTKDDGTLLDDYKKDFPQLYRWYLQDVLNRKPSHPESFKGYMDHAYFSAILLLHRLSGMKELDINTDYTDSLCAILLHNSIFKRAVVTNGNKKHAFTIDEGPLTYLLMLCDELQCWDRTSYGLNNRNAIYAMDARFIFDKEKVTVKYVYDSYFKKKGRLEYCEWIKEQAVNEGRTLKDFYENRFIKLGEDDYKNIYGKVIYKDTGNSVYEYFKNVIDNPSADLPGKMNDYLKMSVLKEGDCSKFFEDIKEIVVVDGKEGILLDIPPVSDKEEAGFIDSLKPRRMYLSQSSYMHLYDFAAALANQYNCRNYKDKKYFGASQSEMEKTFDDLSLEYKISNINQAKSFGRYLDMIGCFYTDRSVGYPMVPGFEPDELKIIGKEEHQRWWDEKISMGWIADEWIVEPGKEPWEGHGKTTKEFDFPNNKWLRECTRIHVDMRDNELLAPQDADKDTDPMNDMMRLLEEYDGLRIYRYRDKE